MERDAPSDLSRRRGQANRWLAAMVCTVGLATWTTGRWVPGVAGWYPACPFFEWTGWLCPGCGGTRAIAALLHGHVAEAVRWNGLVVAALIVALGYAGAAYVRAMTGRERAWMEVPRWLVVAGLVGAAVFGVTRNLG